MLGAARLTTKNLTPSYSVGISPAVTNEGVAGQYAYIDMTIYYNETSIGDTIVWEVVPVSGNITADDFFISQSTVVIGVVGPIVVQLAIKGDSLTEGTESFYVRIRTFSNQTLAISNTVTIIDSSTNANYIFTSPITVSNPNEGTSTTFTLQTTNVPNGQQLRWDIDPAGNNTQPSAADFTIGTMTGFITINNNVGTLTLSYVNDNLFEGSEAYYLIVTRMDGTTISSPLVNIQDTSDGGASLKIYPDAYGLGEHLKLALPFRTATQFNDISWQFFESTQNVAATRTGPIGVVISSSGQRFYDGAFIGDGTQTSPRYVLSSNINTRSPFCVMFWAKTSSANWNNWVFGNNESGSFNVETGISLSTYNQTPSPNGDLMRLITYGFDSTLYAFRDGDGAAGRIGGLNANQWYHFCFSKTSWWVNGQYKGNMVWGTKSWTSIVVGTQQYGGGFSGGIQDFRVYVGNNVIQDYANFTPPTQMMPT